jgi:hypothetical protein
MVMSKLEFTRLAPSKLPGGQVAVEPIEARIETSRSRADKPVFNKKS